MVTTIQLDENTKKTLDKLKKDIEKNGVSIDQYLQEIKKDEKTLFEEFKVQAEKRAKADALYKRRNFSPDQVAAAIFDAVQSNPALSLVGAEAWTTRLLSRFAPVLSRQVARLDITA